MPMEFTSRSNAMRRIASGLFRRAREPVGLPIFDIGKLLNCPRSENEAQIRSLCATVNLGNDILCRVLGRYKMFVDINDAGLAPHLMLDGYWEMQVTEAMMRLVQAGMTVVDVGANQGYFTMLLADLVGPTGKIYAAEPNPRMMSLLQRSARVNGFDARTVGVTQPLSAQSGAEVTLHIPKDFPQNGSMHWTGDDRSEAITLTTVTFDELIGDGPVDFIKIDVEGAEENVWAGMTRVIARNKPLSIILEFTPARYQDPEAFLRHILSGGFALGVIHPTNGIIAATVETILAGPAHIDRMLVLAR